MNYGFQNEIDFVNLFKNKNLDDLDEHSQLFLMELFDNKIDNTDIILCWKNKINQKADIFIKFKDYVKGVSLKCGNSNSVHHENIEDFKMYLGKVGIPYDVINLYTGYHYGYERDTLGNIDFSKSLSSEEYKLNHQKEIDIFNSYVNKTKLIVNMIDRFIVRGKNSEYDIDALVSGTVDNYVWILKYDIYDLILSKRCLEFTSPHVACLTIGPQKRNLNHNSKNAKDRYQVCIRWNFIREDIENFKKCE